MNVLVWTNYLNKVSTNEKLVYVQWAGSERKGPHGQMGPIWPKDGSALVEGDTQGVQ